MKLHPFLATLAEITIGFGIFASIVYGLWVVVS